MSICILKLVVLVLLIINLDTSKSNRFYSVAPYQLSFKPRYRIKILVVEHRIIRMQLPAILLGLLFLKFLVILRQIPALTEPGVKTKSQAILLVNEWLQTYPWLRYSHMYDGAFCLPCILFGNDTPFERLDKLFKAPLKLWTSAAS